MKTKRIFWGIAILLIALGLIAAQIPPISDLWIDFKLWQLLAVLAFGYWLFDRLANGRGIAGKSVAIIPAALLFLTFERNIGTLLFSNENFVNNLVVIIIALLLVTSSHLLFGNKGGKAVANAEGPLSGKYYFSSLGNNTVYFDLSKGTSFTAENKTGQLNIYFQNEIVNEKDIPIELNLANELGETNVHIPADWEVDCRMTSSLGSINIEQSVAEKQRRFIINGTNKLGETNIKY